MSDTVKYLSDKFLGEFTERFEERYLPLYVRKDKQRILEAFTADDVLIDSKIPMNSVSLDISYSDKNDAWKKDFENGKKLYGSLSQISDMTAVDQKFWIALENTTYLDYHLSTLPTDEAGITAHTIFKYGPKRSAAMHNLSVLWWSVRMTYDKDFAEDPYHLTKFFFQNASSGDKLIWLASNVISSSVVALGILDGIKSLCENNIILPNRYAFSNANKAVNQSGGVLVVDMLSRQEICKIVVDNVPEMEHTKLVKN